MATTHPGAWSSLLGNASAFGKIREIARVLYEDSQTALPQPTSRLSVHELSARLRQLGADFKAAIAETGPQQPLVALRIAGIRVHYSTAPLHELDPISIAEMEYNAVHHGRVLLLRIASLSTRTVGITQVIAEDMRGWAIPITLWRLSLIDSDPSIGEYLPVGCIIAVKEPSLRSTSEGRLIGEGLSTLPISIEPSLHIDNNADIVRLSKLSSLLQGTAWSPMELGFSSPSKTSYLHNQARSAFKSRKWRMARDTYSSVIESMEPPTELLQNSLMIERAACQLELQEHHAALQDLYNVSSSAAFPSLDEALRTQTKRLIARVQYALRHYKDAIAVTRELSDSVESRQDIERTRTRLLEAQTGDYPWIELRRRSLAPDTFFLDVADYLGPVMPSTVPGNGHSSGRKRRLITTRAVQPGEILLVVKAKASNFVDMQATHLTLGFDLVNEPPVFPDTLSLSHTVLRQAERDPEWATELSQMYAGPAYEDAERMGYPSGTDIASVSPTLAAMRQFTPCEHSTLWPVDPARVEGICVNNNTLFSAPPWRNVYPLGDDPVSPKAERQQGVALFSAVAHSIRHACRSNSCRSQIGDVLVITASTYIAASAEVNVAYISPYQPYSDREKRLRLYNMSCDCPVCQADRFELNQGHTSEVLSYCSSRYQELSKHLPTIPPHKLLQTEQEIHDLLHMAEGVYAQFRRFRPLTYSLYKILINTILRRRAYSQASVQATEIDPKLIALIAMAFESIDATLRVCPHLSPDFDFQGDIFDRFPVLDDFIGVVDLCLLSSVLFENHGNTIISRRWCEMAEKIHDIHMGPGHWAISRQNQPLFGFLWKVS